MSLLSTFSQIGLGVTLIALLIALLMYPTFRAILASRTLPSFQHDQKPKELLILGDGVARQSLLRRILQDNGNRYNLIGFLEKNAERVGQLISSNSQEVPGTARILGTYDTLSELASLKKVKEVWINDPSIQPAMMQTLSETCRKLQIDLSLVPSIGGFPPQALEVEMLDFVPVLRKKQVRYEPVYELSKRLIDVVLSSILLILTSPLLLLASLLVKHGSRGPILFKQTRIGLNGKPFRMFKFRTMCVEADPYTLTPQSSSDSRITPIGRFFRRTSIG